jgi:hypothetical protein
LGHQRGRAHRFLDVAAGALKKLPVKASAVNRWMDYWAFNSMQL